MGVLKDRAFPVVLWGVAQAMRAAARAFPAFATKIAERDMLVSIETRDRGIGRWYRFERGQLTTGAGPAADADVRLLFKDSDTGFKLLTPPMRHFDYINAIKMFKLDIVGDDEATRWFTEVASLMMSAHWSFGTKMSNGETRYVNDTNGGPVFVYVKDGKIVRMTPIEFEADEAAKGRWSVSARGKTFTPPAQTSISSHGLSNKSTIYSKDRLLHPMKRVDFDPNGARNPQNRGVSGYERISWDEALDIVASEIRRMKTQHGNGAIFSSHSSHHTWGNLGYYLCSLFRFNNAIGTTKMVINPDSWEGWYWGAMHHYGYSMRNGAAEPYGQVEDCLENCELMVFWSSDPEATTGSYSGLEGTIRRLWAKDVGIEMIHIDPYLNSTAAFFGGKWISIRPGTDPALAQAIMYVWIVEGLYDKDYVAERTTGFDAWRAHLLGEDGTAPKTPEWQEAETGVPAPVVRALARKWGTKRTYLSCGGKGTTFGGANRAATGSQWARSMVLLMAMQGLGKPGVNFGCLQYGAPVDLDFYFPGYAEGGFSGDVEGNAVAISLYQRMPHLISMNSVGQRIPRLRIPEAILDGKTEGYPTDPRSLERQFAKFGYPAPGHSPIRMMYKYGGSHFGTSMDSNRLAKAYRSDSLEFVVNQSIWNEGEVPFADVILPACTNFERWDISEWAAAGGYSYHNEGQLNHRVITLQHKCIEPLGESRSDFQIFLDISKRLGLSAYFAEGRTELDWCKMMFEASDVSKHISWRKFLKKGYFVVPAEKDNLRQKPAYKWFAEGRKKDVPEPHPLPSEYREKYGHGLQTQSGKIEFVSNSLARANDPERPALNRYIPSWEGLQTTDLLPKYPLQLISPHPRFSFHTAQDGKGGFVNDIDEHRMLVDGWYYWVARISPSDAAARGIAHGDLVRLFNDRGAVICAAMVTERIQTGVIHAFESSAVYAPLGTPGESADRGGCINQLTPKRFQTDMTNASAPNSCLIQIEKWDGTTEIAA